MANGPRKIHVKTRERKGKCGTSWQYYFHYYTSDGKRRVASRRGFTTKETAENAGEAALKEYLKSQRVDKPEVFKMDVRQFVLEVWLTHAQDDLAVSTRKNYGKLLRHILGPFGTKRLRDLKEDELKQHFDHLYLETKLSISTIDNAQRLFAQILRYAVHKGYLDFSPLSTYRKPNFNERPPICKKNGQVRDIIPDDVLDALYRRYSYGSNGYLFFKIGELTGMRLGEVAGLAFEDCDFDNRLIFVSRQIKVLGRNEKLRAFEEKQVTEHPELKKCKYVARNPKYDSKRVIPMTDELYELLMETKALHERNQRILGSDYINYYYTREYDPCFSERTYASFSRKNGKNGGYDPKRVENGIINTVGIGYPLHFVNVKESGELVRPDYDTDILAVAHGKTDGKVISKTLNYHSLRNTYASRLREAGVEEHLVSAVLGHKQETTTMGYMRVGVGELSAITGKNHAFESPVSVVDNSSFAAYLASLDKDGLKQAMNAVYERMMAGI